MKPTPLSTFPQTLFGGKTVALQCNRRGAATQSADPALALAFKYIYILYIYLYAPNGVSPPPQIHIYILYMVWGEGKAAPRRALPCSALAN